MIRRTALLLFLMVLAATLNAREAVRQQIERQQRETGLRLVTFARKISTVNFSDRSPELKDVKVSGDGRPLQGAISRDGQSIAFEISFYHPARWTLGVAHSDGTGLQEYPNIASPSSICWSNDKSTLALSAAVPQQSNGALLMVRLDSHATQQIDIQLVGPHRGDRNVRRVAPIGLSESRGGRERSLPQVPSARWS
jgi:hypothetical protein